MTDQGTARDSDSSPRSHPTGPVPELNGPGVVIPQHFRRIGQKGLTWDIPRSFPGYFADASKQVLGASTKYVIRTTTPDAPQYLIKYAQKHGERETLTEFFINRLGLAVGLNMAHSGLVLADGVPTFLTRIFTSDRAVLVHGSLVIEDCFKREQTVDLKELDRIDRRSEQAFYSIDFVIGVLQQFCGEQFDAIIYPFVEMLVFDALIGSMDRHSQNWGLLRGTVEPVSYRFAPVFDTARALLWSLDEQQITKLGTDENAFTSFIERAKPCMGPVRNHPKVNKCNHFDFIENLMDLYPVPVTAAVQKLSKDIGPISAKILKEFPFAQRFTRTRKRLIIKILLDRASRLRQILEKGGSH